jgi:hypothetical protein
MYQCAGLQPVVFAARLNEPCLAGTIGLEPIICWLTASDPRPVRSMPIISVEIIFYTAHSTGCTRGEHEFESV